MDPIAIVLNGASSSGKSSIAKALQQLWSSPLIHASLDCFTDVFDWPSITNSDLRADCHRFGVGAFHHYLSHVANSQFSVVVDHVFEQPAWYQTTRDAFPQRSILFVAVRCDLETLEQREQARGDRRIGLARWQHQRVHAGLAYDLDVDTSEQSVTDCAKMILDYSKSNPAGSLAPSIRKNRPV